jgi:hypothetical protein
LFLAEKNKASAEDKKILKSEWIEGNESCQLDTTPLRYLS